MAFLAVVGSKAVNGVAAIHSEIIKETIFKVTGRLLQQSEPLHQLNMSSHGSQMLPWLWGGIWQLSGIKSSESAGCMHRALRKLPVIDHLQPTQNFYELEPAKFQNKTNGVTPRRWLAYCNPELSALITETLGTEKWITEAYLLEGLRKHADDKQLQAKWRAVKQEKKKRLAHKIKVGPCKVKMCQLYNGSRRRPGVYRWGGHMKVLLKTCTQLCSAAAGHPVTCCVHSLSCVCVPLTWRVALC